MQKRNILFAVLNWGLGHATRSLPIIKVLIQNGHHVTIASDGDALAFLKNEIVEADFLALPGYQISYGTSKLWLAAVQNGPGILKAIKKENQKIQDWVERNDCDLIISDCRFGCYSPEVRSIVISHILQLPNSGLMAVAASTAIQKRIHRFNECWIPDETGSTLSGKLSQTDLKIPQKYIGWLSTLDARQILPDTAVVSAPGEALSSFSAIAIISGPEPARSEFERKVIDQLSACPGEFLVIGGRLSHDSSLQIPSNIQYKSWVDRKTLNHLILNAEIVICRTGYSSLMDLMKVGKKAILIPTPGQPEQEYLGEQLSASNWCLVQFQERMDLGFAMDEMNKIDIATFHQHEFSKFKAHLDF